VWKPNQVLCVYLFLYGIRASSLTTVQKKFFILVATPTASTMAVVSLQHSIQTKHIQNKLSCVETPGITIPGKSGCS
jgi:hypothetical protein